MNVTELITTAFRSASMRYPELYKSWGKITRKVGGVLPNSLLFASIQRIGELDLVLRCMEDELAPPSENTPQWSIQYQLMLSEIWIGVAYESFRLIINRKLAEVDAPLLSVAHDLRLLRVTLEKHEIAGDRALSEALPMQPQPPRDESDIYYYSKDDERRSHIMPSGFSRRGSAMWFATDIIANNSVWIERRDLSDRIIAIWERSQY